MTKFSALSSQRDWILSSTSMQNTLMINGLLKRSVIRE